METDASVSYRAWGSDNISYGPVELPGLVNWIKQGRVTAETRVFSQKDGAWQRASDVPELKILFKTRPPSGGAPPGEEMSIKPNSLRRIKMLAEVDESLLASL